MLIPEFHATLDALYLAIEVLQSKVNPDVYKYFDTGELAFLYSTGND